MTTWIFQGNPKLFDVTGYLESQREVLWGANQSFTKMAVGDTVYFWRSVGEGTEHSGILAKGVLLDEPKERVADAAASRFWKTAQPTEFARQVRVRIDDPAGTRLLPAAYLLRHPQLKELEILKVPNATNFRVLPDQEKALGSVWDESSKRPVVSYLAGSLSVDVSDWRKNEGAQAMATRWRSEVATVRPLAADLFRRFLAGELSLVRLKESFDRQTRLKEWEPLGLGGPNGAMVLNKWTKHFSEAEMTSKLLRLFAPPDSRNEARSRLVEHLSYLQGKVDDGELASNQTGLKRTVAFVSAVWQLLDDQKRWPTFYTSARDALLGARVLLKRDDIVQSYFDFVDVTEELARQFGLDFDDVHKLLHWKNEAAPPAMASERIAPPTAAEATEPNVTPYTRADALRDLFLEEAVVDDMLASLLRRKNLILQGPPGVGKTFVAKRLAYLLMEQKAPEQLAMVQFHQSYSYEDFVQGFRPTETGGFRREDGPFVRFCQKALQDPRSRYVLIIDEINRGNVSRIFGELLMLLYADKRGSEWGVQLAYSQPGEGNFYIPANVFVIGTMNTADRSLALVDYALRRRFAFIDIPPGFETTSFTEVLLSQGATAPLVEQLKTAVAKLNDMITKDPVLGAGYQVGHSYFCDGELEDRNEDWLDRVFRLEIEPLLREYWRDSPTQLDQARKHLELG